MARQTRLYGNEWITKSDLAEFATKQDVREEINKAIDRLEKSQKEWANLFVEHTKSSIKLLAEDIKVSESRFMLESKKLEARLAADRAAMEQRLEADRMASESRLERERKESEARLEKERVRSDMLLAEERKESRASRRALNANFIAQVTLIIAALGLIYTLINGALPFSPS